MAYADLLEREGIASNYLVVLNPRRIENGWSAVPATSYYEVDFDFGTVTKVEANGVELTEVANEAAISADTWYYAQETGILYARTASGTPLSNIMVVTYEIYLATVDAHWHRVATDDTTTEVYYEPLITRSPVVNQQMTDSLTGYIPSSTGALSISNLTSFMNKHVYDSSFNKTEIKMYHYLDKLEIENVKLVIDGITTNVSWTDRQVDIQIQDRLDIFSDQLTSVGFLNNTAFLTTTLFSDLDPDADGRPIRLVYGIKEKLVGTNIDYNATAPTTSNNRNWVISGNQFNTQPDAVSETVPASPTSTATRTYVPDADAFKTGDTVWKDAVASTTDEYFEITNVDYASNYIEHAAIGDPAQSTDLIKRGGFGNVKVIVDGVQYTTLFQRDWTSFSDGFTGTHQIRFTSSMESNVGISTIDPTNIIVFARAYGGSFGSSIGLPAVEENGGATQNIVGVLYNLLSSNLGIPDAEINLTEFTSVAASVTDKIGVAIPERFDDTSFPTAREVVAQILQTGLLRLFLDDDNKWSINQLGPVGSSDKTIEDDEILNTSARYQFDYKDVYSEVVVRYNSREVTQFKQIGESISSVTSTSSTASYLHKAARRLNMVSYHINAADAQTLADRLKYALGDRRGLITINTKNRFFNTELDDVITVTRENLPGFEYAEGVDRSRDFVVNSTNKSLNQITITIDDQKGIEDNSGSW